MTPSSKKGRLYQQYKKEKLMIRQDEVRKLDRPFTPLGKLVSILIILLCILAIWRFTSRGDQWYLLGGIMFIYLVIKQIFALLYRPCRNELTKDYKVSVIITCFNEDPTSVATVFENILAFDYPVHEVLFLDDGSSDTLGYRVAKSFAEAHKHIPGVPDFKIVRFKENRGKRALMIDGFQLATGDYIFLLDSDSEILPNALTELLRPFEDGKTTSVVGNIGILNRSENFVTKLQGITYFGAFQMGRAAQSITGDVVVCSGAFSIHKKDFILENLEELREDNLFGISVSAGDDRSLTAFSRASGGKTRYQSTAYCETYAPNTWKKLRLQRRRWQRSGYIGVLKVIKDIFPRKLWFLFWGFAETYLWLIATILFTIQVLAQGFYFDPVGILIWHCIMSFKHNGFYFLYRPLHFIVTPFYTFIYGFFLLFIRVLAGLTLADDGWGTRGSANEAADKAPVSLAPIYNFAWPKPPVVPEVIKDVMYTAREPPVLCNAAA